MKLRMYIPPRSVYMGVAAALLAGLAGCSGGPVLGEVEGVVTKDGKPLAGLLVTFVPESVKGMADGRVSVAETDEAGHFVLQFADDKNPRPGAVVGAHKVTLQDVAWENARDDPNRGQPRVPGPYLYGDSSPLGVEVKPGKQTIDLDVK